MGEIASIKGAEIFAAGEWNGLSFTESDLDSIVASFDAMNLAGRVPLKFGHTGSDARDGAPALGWVDKIYRDGGKLLADFTSIPSVVYDAIKEGMYKFVSVELLKDVQANTRQIPWVLDAVALLGADQPAVGILKDLQALTMTRGTGLRGSSRVAFRRDFETIKDPIMSEEIKTLQDQLKVLMSRIDASDARAAGAEQALELERARQHKAQLEVKRADVAALFERAIVAREIVPAVRESFSKVYRLEEDAFLERVSLDDAKAFIRANAISKKQETTLMSRQNGDEMNGTNAEVVNQLARQENVARGFRSDDAIAIVESTKAVFRRNPQLATAYFNEPDAAHKVEA
ncbi:hypothetical protein UFOVP820_2 [uncultured Caudovirales phage]|uniref:Uncharacterized protein n=1 Tax=uncultured Caudovirales phage TaxID=2100421 RepID=A0A6J5P4X0_9CAUD|nr:hypothetical protein UFOVP820_2 [uncultured Caudovirales phage]